MDSYSELGIYNVYDREQLGNFSNYIMFDDINNDYKNPQNEDASREVNQVLY